MEAGRPARGTGETPALHPNYRKWNQSPITVASSARLKITLSRCSAAVSAAGLWSQHRSDVHLVADRSEGQAGQFLRSGAGVTRLTPISTTQQITNIRME